MKRSQVNQEEQPPKLTKMTDYFVHAEKMLPRNPMPTRLRLPLAYPPREEVAFDSESNALCTKPQCLANEFESNKLSKMLMLIMYTTYAHAVPHHGGLVATEDLLLKIKDGQVLVFLNLRLNSYINYMCYLTFKYSCCLLYLF